MTTITKRSCKLGPSINCRTEKHGDDDTPACDIPIVDALLEKAEVNALFGDLFWESLYDTRLGDGPPRVLFPNVAPRHIQGKYSGHIRIVLGANRQDVEPEGVTITSITADPKQGGLVAVSLKAQTSTDIEKFVHKLVARQNTEVEVEFTIGEKVEKMKGQQKELPLQGAGPTAAGNNGGETNSDENCSDEQLRRNQIHAAALASSTAAAS